MSLRQFDELPGMSVGRVIPGPPGSPYPRGVVSLKGRSGAVDRSSLRAVTAACVGNVMEWYDFAVYGAFAGVLGRVFFPADGAAALFAAFAVYGVAFLVRPVGALVVGRLGDSRGRKPALVAVVMMMSVATAAVGLLPTYAAVGMAAPLALVVLRCLQGFAAGGEVGVSAVFIAEQAPAHRRGAWCAWHTATMVWGIALALAVAALVVAAAPAGADDERWWRVAFLLAIPLGYVGVYLRRRVPETALFTQAAAQRTGAAGESAWAVHRAGLVTGFLVVAAASLAFNTFFIYLPNAVAADTAIELDQALATAFGGLAVTVASALLCGRLSDRVGRRPLVLSATGALALSGTFLVEWSSSGSLVRLAVADVVAGLLIGGALSIAMLAEMFPTSVRATAVAMSAGLATALVGGTAPFVLHVVVTTSDLSIAPGLYVAVFAAAAFVAVLRWPETAFGPLR